MSSPESDAEIIEASLGNPDVFTVIFERHYPAVFRFVTAAVGRTDGPDLASEVFVRAFAARHRYRLTYPDARPWLWGIASNLVSGYYRSQARERRAYRRIPRPPAFEPDSSGETVDRVATQAKRPHLAAAMAQLRSDEADVVVLFAVGGLSYAEIAQALEIPEGTVRSRLSRARHRLRNLLGPIGESIDDDE